MISFCEFLKIDCNDSIGQLVDSDWVVRTKLQWRNENGSQTLEIHNDGYDDELRGESWTVSENTYHPKIFAFLCKQFIETIGPSELNYARSTIYSRTT